MGWGEEQGGTNFVVSVPFIGKEECSYDVDLQSRRETKVPPVRWDGKCACAQRHDAYRKQRTNLSKQETEVTFFSHPHSHKPPGRRECRSASVCRPGRDESRRSRALPAAARGQWLCEVRVAYRACMLGKGALFVTVSHGYGVVMAREGSRCTLYFAPRGVRV